MNGTTAASVGNSQFLAQVTQGGSAATDSLADIALGYRIADADIHSLTPPENFLLFPTVSRALRLRGGTVRNEG